MTGVAIRRPSGTSPRPAVALLLGVLVLLAAALLVTWFALDDVDSADPRPELQQVLHGLVGPNRVAPGVTAYVSGPHGSWAGSAGVSNIETGSRMPVDARMRLESLSKAWTAALLLQLVGEGRLRLDDPVERWLPRLLPDGHRITVRQLLDHTSGLIDNNDVSRAPAAHIALVGDAALRARLNRVLQRARADPVIRFPARLWVELAAWLPLQSEPGTRYHYSNIGYDVAGMVAEKVARRPIARLYEERIIRPLGLAHTAYDPQGAITGPHARGYQTAADGSRIDATAWHGGVGAEGGIVASAEDEARFLRALMDGTLLGPAQRAALKTPASAADSAYALGVLVVQSGCGDVAYHHGGAGPGFKTSVFVSGDGSRVAVVLANGNRRDAPAYYAQLDEATRRLYCAA